MLIILAMNLRKYEGGFKNLNETEVFKGKNDLWEG